MRERPPHVVDRLTRAIVAGFVATATMTVVLLLAYVIATALGRPEPAPLFLRWLWALTHNPLGDLASGALFTVVSLHLAFGLIWALVYAVLFEPVLPGPALGRGLLFALLPWLLSVVVLFPFLGAGLFGLALGAGPLPALSNLVIHLVYGATLGVLCDLADSVGLETTPLPPDLQARAMAGAERGAAVGVVVGLLAGGLFGFVLGQILPLPGLPLPAVTVAPVVGMTLAFAVLGGAAGLAGRDGGGAGRGARRSSTATGAAVSAGAQPPADPDGSGDRAGAERPALRAVVLVVGLATLAFAGGVWLVDAVAQALVGEEGPS